MKKLEQFVESIILASRWLLVVFYLGLAAGLALYAVSFGKKLWDFAGKVFMLDETDTILKTRDTHLLGLILAAKFARLEKDEPRARRRLSASSFNDLLA